MVARCACVSAVGASCRPPMTATGGAGWARRGGPSIGGRVQDSIFEPMYSACGQPSTCSAVFWAEPAFTQRIHRESFFRNLLDSDYDEEYEE